ncbi:unnamed protein product, partial [Mycena citricolor]
SNLILSSSSTAVTVSSVETREFLWLCEASEPSPSVISERWVRTWSIWDVVSSAKSSSLSRGRHASRLSLLEPDEGAGTACSVLVDAFECVIDPASSSSSSSVSPPRPTAQRDWTTRTPRAEPASDTTVPLVRRRLRSPSRRLARGRGQRDARAGAGERGVAPAETDVSRVVLAGPRVDDRNVLAILEMRPCSPPSRFRLQRRLWVGRVSTGAVAAESTHEGTPAAVVAQERVVVIVRDRSRHRDLLPLFVGDGWPRGKLRSLRGLLAREQRDLPRPALARSRARTQLDGLWKRHGGPFFA